MRRAALWLLCTVAALVLVFSTRINPGAAAGGARTHAGRVVPTPPGPVQVVVTIDDGRITGVAVPVFPDSNAVSERISEAALPVLQRATLTAQSARVDAVSGATVTSEGYRRSLQSALDAAAR
ncbi:FMN-binding protein [Pseudosporangium ferrugineum]|uniref:FMN-binding protein n=1 Tax=Pseudosporangium ferrugineum TaxID=439699 RepID=A0A2T0SBI2_9ACTN|nr:FMN-binding protein [Pseudosporangium ferrugineum]PRY30789.1 FMN-binding protein [Pseudosporangium ferrugineum]